MTETVKSEMEKRLEEIEPLVANLWEKFLRLEDAAKPQIQEINAARTEWCKRYEEVEWLKQRLAEV